MRRQASISSWRVRPVVRRPYSTLRPASSPRVTRERAASTVPWQIAATGRSCSKKVATADCSSGDSRYSRMPGGVAAGQQHRVEPVRGQAAVDVGPRDRRAIGRRLRHAVVVGHGVALRAQHRREQAEIGTCEHSRVGLRGSGVGRREDARVAGLGQHAPGHAGLGRVEVEARQRDEDGGQGDDPVRRRTAAACRPGGSPRPTGARRSRRRRACRAKPRPPT